MEPDDKKTEPNGYLEHRGRMRRKIQDEPLISLDAYRLMEMLLF